MTIPRIARSLSLDFPDVPDDAPAPVQASVEQRIVAGLAQLGRAAGEPAQAKQPRVWQRQDNTCSDSHPCDDCKAAVERMVAREALVGPLLRRCP